MLAIIIVAMLLCALLSVGAVIVDHFGLQDNDDWDDA
jgi:hypothetical protein